MDGLKPGAVIVTNNPPVTIKGEMSLRDYFAAKAMQGLIERYDCELPGDIAAEAYDYADAMLEARHGR
jgi:hypothetical protein